MVMLDTGTDYGDYDSSMKALKTRTNYGDYDSSMQVFHMWTLTMSTITLSSAGQHWTDDPGFADVCHINACRPAPASVSFFFFLYPDDNQHSLAFG